MNEVERLRAQATRCTQLAQESTDKVVIDALLGLAAKCLEQASDLERQAFQREQNQADNVE
jgi:hypothetical protein